MRWLSDNWLAILTGLVAVVTASLAVFGVVWKAGQLEQRLAGLEQTMGAAQAIQTRQKVNELEARMIDHWGANRSAIEIILTKLEENRFALDCWAQTMYATQVTE